MSESAMPDGPFEAMGRPIGEAGRRAAQELLDGLLALTRAEVAEIVDALADSLEENEPAVAFTSCKKWLGNDVTLHYRLIATLLAYADMSSEQVRGGKGTEDLVETW
jgi:hypothetical protein